ncbi:hypothetical protein A5668_27895 [Mycolicibacterium fortuitum]|uniref:nucleoside triphosphate pyrophosphohydrolase n=1 Tax=Mycolicibacterium fortuitum TaxID=1766 RepID=UPI0007E92973|nr:nucleoside triphosphate pyrophosphohydrolase [Mycolicibacterium fortuitum]OBA99627.1 hypothetical protein A5668_27895 [Mycolicibacterium fortuitum]
MTEGKLVRDLIPELIRQSGRNPNVRHISGEELVRALGAKLIEEAQEAAAALTNRDELIEELADLSEVIAVVMKVRGIDEREVTDAAAAKAGLRGRFETGAWLISPALD